jgi:hypothetical protein
MNLYTPIKSYLDTCTAKQLTQLSVDADVPLGTLTKIKTGETKNPGVLTCEKIWPHIPHGKHKRRLSDRRHDRRRTVIKAETP